ncbi:MAG TPA: hypothetical protein VGF32_13310 [Streptosporangiaceae bacterium]|jgi:hypothetical protein
MADPARVAAVPAAGEAVEACWLCGIHLPVAQLVADGSDACADLRWYCRDTRACTERWTSRRAPAPAAETPPPSRFS